MNLLGSPFGLGRVRSRQSSGCRISPTGSSDIQIDRDPFVILAKNSSNKLLPLSPKFKLPKIQAALPPRPSLGLISNKPQETPPKSQNDPKKTEEKCEIQPAPKSRRIRISETHSSTFQKGEKFLKKKRNSVVIVDIENDITFGEVGKLVFKK